MRHYKPLELLDGSFIETLYEDRAVLAVDKPGGWLLAPTEWTRTQRNLQNALVSAIQARAYWARTRNIRFLRYAHRLDAETSGAVLFVKSAGAIQAYSKLFENREVAKVYLAVVEGTVPADEWTANDPIAPDPRVKGRVKLSPKGKPAETQFLKLSEAHGRCLLAAYPLTGRTHQIRAHLAKARVPVLGDPMYGTGAKGDSLGLRSTAMRYRDPFTRHDTEILAPIEAFLREFRFPPLSMEKKKRARLVPELSHERR